MTLYFYGDIIKSAKHSEETYIAVLYLFLHVNNTYYITIMYQTLHH